MRNDEGTGVEWNRLNNLMLVIDNKMDILSCSYAGYLYINVN